MIRSLLGKYRIRGADRILFNRVPCHRTQVQTFLLKHNKHIPEKPHFLKNHALEVTVLMGGENRAGTDDSNLYNFLTLAKAVTVT